MLHFYCTLGNVSLQLQEMYLFNDERMRMCMRREQELYSNNKDKKDFCHKSKKVSNETK